MKLNLAETAKAIENMGCIKITLIEKNLLLYKSSWID